MDVTDLKKELELLYEEHSLAVKEAGHRIQREAKSKHLGHNLASSAVAIAEVQARIDQTNKILKWAESK